MWQMSFNVDKCHVFQISLGRKKPFNYRMDNRFLSLVTNHLYLGLEFDDKIQILGFLRRNLRNCPQPVKELAYTSLVRPKLEYSAYIWDPHHQSKIDISKTEQHDL